MDAVRIEFKDRQWVIPRRFYQSLIELSNLSVIGLAKGAIPDDQREACITLDELVGLLNGRRVRITRFDFEEKEWIQEVQIPRVGSMNDRQRARAIRNYVRSLLTSGHIVAPDMVCTHFPNISRATVRRHINAVSSTLNDESIRRPNGVLRIERRNGAFFPVYGREQRNAG